METESIEAFAEYLMDDDRTSFTFAEARSVAEHAHLSTNKVIDGLKSYGFEYAGRPVPKAVRGFATPQAPRDSHHGGGGGEDILSGFAGPEG